MTPTKETEATKRVTEMENLLHATKEEHKQLEHEKRTIENEVMTCVSSFLFFSQLLLKLTYCSVPKCFDTFDVMKLFLSALFKIIFSTRFSNENFIHIYLKTDIKNYIFG